MSETATPDDFSDLVAAAGSASGFWDNPQDAEWDAAAEAAFVAELERRLEAVARGTADPIPWQQAREELRAELVRRIAARQKSV